MDRQGCCAPYWDQTGLTGVDWVGHELRNWTLDFGPARLQWDLGKSLSSLIGPPVVLPPDIPLCFRVKYRTEGFMGKRRASTHLNCTHCGPLRRPIGWCSCWPTRCADVHTSSLFILSLLFNLVLFSCRFLGFKFYCTVNILCKMKYINNTIQCFSESWYLIFMCKSDNKYFLCIHKQWFILWIYMYVHRYVFSMLC